MLLAPFIGWDIGNLGVYIAALLIMGELITDLQKLRALLSGAAVVSVLASLVFMSVSPLYHKAQYLEDFEKAFATMKEHYVLTEEKAIDWDALYGKYRPLFAEAEKEQDEYLCNASWTKFAQEFYDGHVAYSAADKGAQNELFARLYGKDYGLSMLRLSDGRIAAVNV